MSALIPPTMDEGDQALPLAVYEAIERGKSTNRLITEARLSGNFDQLYDVGGLQPCLRIITILTERLAERVRIDAGRGA